MTDLHLTAPPGGWVPPWPLVTQLAESLPVSSWALVGGLMVQVHARAAGVSDVRPTADVDMLDGKRLRHLRDALADPLSDPWLLLPDDSRQRGQDTLRILGGR